MPRTLSARPKFQRWSEKPSPSAALRLKPVIPVERESDPTHIQRISEENLVGTMRNGQEVEVPLARIDNLFLQELRREATLQLARRIQWLSDGRGIWKFFHEHPESECGLGTMWGANQAPVADGYWALPQRVAMYGAKGWEPYDGRDGRFLRWSEHILMVKKFG